MSDLFVPPEWLHPLLGHLAAASPPSPTDWREWRIEPIVGGRNNLLYHVTSQHGDFAVKFTMRDDRDRAGGEFRALLALREAGLDVAPRPVFLEQARYSQPVVVQTWLEGSNVALAPTVDADWNALIEHYRTVHTITPERTNVSLSAAVLTMDSAVAGRQRIAKELANIPGAEQPVELVRLVDSVEQTDYPEWPPPPVTLCRCDPNPQNFIRRSQGWASVDWEYSGWGDPAFEIADLMAHPAYLEVPASRRDFIVAAYRPSGDDPTFDIRVRVYYRFMLVWWAARFTRTLYEVTRGLDRRLAPRSSAWQAEAEANYETYLNLAMAALA